MDDLDLAYIAGFFDGEGSITISNRVASSCRSLSPNHTVTVSVGNTDPTVVSILHKEFGGSLSFAKAKRENHKDIYQWQISARGACVFLSAIRPFLKMKHKQADIAINFQESKPPYSKTRLTDEVIAWREEQKKKIQDLNGRFPYG